MKKTLLSLQVFLHFFRYCLLFICSSLFAQQPLTSTNTSNFTGATESYAIGVTADSENHKTANTKATIEKHRVWLNLSNTQGAFKQLLIGYITGATNGWDNNYDGLAPDANKYINFYSINDGKKLIIQGRAVPFTDSDVVPLGYKSEIVGELTIAIDHTDGDLDNHPILLADTKTGIVQDLKAGDLTFSTTKGTFDDRFVLSYGKSLGTHDFESIKSNVIVSVKDKIIRLASIPDTKSLNEVVIYDITGKVLYNEKEIGSNQLEISNIQSANQILLVKATLENDYTSTTKIMF